MDEDIELGIIILALVHAGVIQNVSCDTCTDFQKQQYNCAGEDRDEPVFEHDETGQLYSCPLLWITSHIYQLYDELAYYETFPGAAAPSYSDRNERFWQCVKLYKATYNRYAYKQKPGDKDTDKELAKLRKAHLIKRH